MVTQPERRRIRVTGTVQGVGFRPFVYRTAVGLGLSGEVANDATGVVVDAEGDPGGLDELCRRLAEEAPPLARVDAVVATPLPARGRSRGFRIAGSGTAGEPAVPVSVDVGPCADCLGELADPADRRHRYPFVNCTNCGPRYTIVRRVPYDRARTTMATFALCPACRAEYEDPADRRFHAEPTACPACGPRLTLRHGDGTAGPEGDAALDAAVRLLLGGSVLAVKGVGGYHLAVDATDAAAVAELRRRKARDDKPFALLVATVADARRLVALDEEAAAVLAGPRRPIVLAPVTAEGATEVAPAVARGLAELGAMLPPSPLHHLLAAAVGRPLVLTSGNRTDEPIAHEDGDAVARLGPLVDAILAHDRAIHIRCDDSVVRAGVDGHPQVLRRSRGYAPEPLALPVPSARAVLAVGAELKSTVAVTKGDAVVVSHHVGDLEDVRAYQAFGQAVDHLCHLSGVTPEVVAHDLHPEYLSTKFAADLPLPAHGVQHHHAHVASCLVDHGLTGPVLGVAFDGLGYGPDGTLWGGELLVADLGGYRRVGHLRPVALPGGAAAIRQPWRMAVTWVAAAAGPDAAARVGAALDPRWEAVLALAEAGRSLVTTSAGRLFDAVAALLGLRSACTYEGQAAIELEACARRAAGGTPAYPLAVGRDGSCAVLDPGPLVAALLADRERGVPVPRLAAGFHAGLVQATADLAAGLAADHGLDTVALSGGVFQNALLTGLVTRRLRAAGLRVLVHRRVPPNDGGISVGQAAVAAAG